MTAVELLSRAVVTEHPALAVLFAVMGLEAMVLDDRDMKRFGFARHLAFLGCGREHDTLCGRDRSTCPYLATPPDSANHGALVGMEDRARTDRRWTCSQWLDLLDWYKIRNGVAHGGTLDVTREQASKVVFWALRWLAVPAFEWMAAHPTKPVQALRVAINDLPPPPDWEAELAEATGGD